MAVVREDTYRGVLSVICSTQRTIPIIFKKLNMKIPKAFISYSHDSQEHKKWVLELAIRLRNNGIDAIIDQFELKPGDDVPHFMETNLSSADKVIMICSERYVEKANKGEGGVGYEKMIVTSNLLKRIDENKVIPVVRQKGGTAVPTFLNSKLYINFSKDDDYEYNYDDLVRTIHNSPLFEKPQIGNNPFKPVVKESLSGDISLLNSVLIAIATEQGTSTFVNSERVVARLRISPPLYRVMVMKLIELGYAEWETDPVWVKVTVKGLLYLYDNGLSK